MPKKTQAERTAIKYAFWMKWAGTKPVEVTYSKGITKDDWYIRDISDTSPTRKNVTKVTPSKLDNPLTNAV